MEKVRGKKTNKESIFLYNSEGIREYAALRAMDSQGRRVVVCDNGTGVSVFLIHTGMNCANGWGWVGTAEQCKRDRTVQCGLLMCFLTRCIHCSAMLFTIHLFEVPVKLMKLDG